MMANTTLEELVRLWNIGSAIPVDDKDFTAESWAGFPPGTPRDIIWEWFDEQHPDFSVKRALQGEYDDLD